MKYAAVLALALGLVCGSVAAQNSAQATESVKKIRAERAAGQEGSAKPVAKSPTATAKATPAKAMSPSAGAQSLKACKDDAGLNPIKRERCVWTLCKGRWGQGDCPPQGSASYGR